MADNLPVIWSKPAHTSAKHQILETYLNAWMPIMSHQSRRVGTPGAESLFVEGFAGPDGYSGGEDGSPILAIRPKHRSTGSRGVLRNWSRTLVYSGPLQNIAESRPLTYNISVNPIQKIKEAVRKLDPADLAEFRAWFAEFDAERWDRQMEADVAAGRLDDLAEGALRDLREGRCTDL